jgi:putative ABC transport system permease protein
MRFLMSSPLLSFVAIVSCAFGIGANAAIFSIIDSLLLRPLPVRDFDRLAFVTSPQNPEGILTFPIWEQIQQHQELFDGVAAWSEERFDLSARGESEFVDGVFVSGGFFEMLGVTPEIGRVISMADDRAESRNNPVAMISHRLWQRQFAGKTDVIGSTLLVGRHPFTIVGVVPPSFFGLDVGTGFDVAVPYNAEPLLDGNPSLVSAPTAWWVKVVLKRRTSQPLAASTASLRGIQSSIRMATLPGTYTREQAAQFLTDPFELVPVSQGVSQLGAQYQQPLMTLLAIAVLVLLIACANIANLLLARTSSRRHELTVRRALGASGPQLAAQLAAESLLLAGIGAVIGLFCALWGSRLLVQQLSTFNRLISLDLSVDWRVLAFTVGLTLWTAVLFGTIPALGAARTRPNDVLKQHARTVMGGRRLSPSQLIVVAQVALAMVLVFSAGLFIRTFVALTKQHVGVTRDRVFTVRVDSDFRSAKPEAAMAEFERLRTAAADVPGVAMATMSSMTPVNGMLWQFLLDVPDAPSMTETERSTLANLVGPDYFSTLGTRLLAGREFGLSDGRFAPPVAIVNEAFVRKYLGGHCVVGHHIRQGGYAGRPTIEREIVGCAEDSVYRTLREVHEPTVYLPIAQRPQPPPYINISVRAAGGSPALLGPGVVRAISAVDPEARLSPRLLSEQIDSSVAQERVIAILSGLFGGLALLLAALGLYGVTAYGVSRRRTEIGVRLALGAGPGTIVQMVLRRVALQVATGAALGIIASLWVSRLVAKLLYGVQPQDPFTLGAGAILLVASTVVAGWLPARSASRSDPAQVLRDA